MIKIKDKNGNPLKFNSMKDAYQFFGFKENQIYAPAFRKKIAPEQVLQILVLSNGERINWNKAVNSKPKCKLFGQTYYSLNEVSRDTNVDVTLIRKLFKENKLNEKNIKKAQNRKVQPITINNVLYNSCRSACKELNVSYVTVNAKIRSGMSKEEAINYCLNLKKKHLTE